MRNKLVAPVIALIAFSYLLSGCEGNQVKPVTTEVTAEFIKNPCPEGLPLTQAALIEASLMENTLFNPPENEVVFVGECGKQGLDLKNVSVIRNYYLDRLIANRQDGKNSFLRPTTLAGDVNDDAVFVTDFWEGSGLSTQDQRNYVKAYRPGLKIKDALVPGAKELTVGMNTYVDLTKFTKEGAPVVYRFDLNNPLAPAK